MKTTDKEFTDKLNKLCSESWKAAAILKHNNGCFENIPEFQQKMFIEFMGSPEVKIVKSLIKECLNSGI